MKGCFYQFHIDKKILMQNYFDKGFDLFLRNANSKKAKEYIKQHLPELNSVTVEINSQETLDAFCANNPNFKIDPEGYDPLNFALMYFKELSEPMGWKYGQLGIWASNYTAWLNFLETDYDYVMLIEDDVYFEDGAFETFEECIKELPDNWEIYHYCVPKTKFQARQIPKDVWNTFDIGKDKICLPYIDDSNACYIINRKGVEKLLKQVQEGIFLPLDWHWFKQPLFNIYATKPEVNTYCDLITIKSTHWDYESFVKLPIVS
jgi:GR25 family glycosyltransferase involved in LPS biosynthesis